MMMETFNNTTRVVRDDLKKTINSKSKISIAAAYFSIYAYEALQSELEQCKEFRFIFTSPTFVTEKEQKQRREFYIPRLNREKVFMEQNLKCACVMNSRKKPLLGNVRNGCGKKRLFVPI